MKLRVRGLALGCLIVGAACGGGDNTSTADTAAADTVVESDAAVVSTSAPAASPASPAEPDSTVEMMPSPLSPTSTFAVTDVDEIQRLVMAPDGSRVALHLLPGLGEPGTIRIYDIATGEMLTEATFDYRFADVRWDGNNRLTAVDDFDEAWHNWDADTLSELGTAPFEYECYLGPTDPNTGYRYSWTGDDSLCLVDPATGETIRSAPGVIVDPDNTFWVRPERAEVVVVHWPADQPVLLTLDAATFEPITSTSLSIETMVRAVGQNTWLDDAETAVLEPAAVPAPDVRHTPAVSTYGRFFFIANGNDDVVFYSAADGSTVGSMPVGFNPSAFAAWSTDDTHLARLTLDGTIEIYELGNG